jgi:uncharacterized protein YggL (DUF469 family)
MRRLSIGPAGSRTLSVMRPEPTRVAMQTSLEQAAALAFALLRFEAGAAHNPYAGAPLRKKRRRREFQEMGFALRFDRLGAVESADAFFDAFVQHLETSGLAFAGRASEDWDGFVTSLGPRGTVSPGQRAVVSQWLASRPDVQNFSCGELVDAWQSTSLKLPHQSAT